MISILAFFIFLTVVLFVYWRILPAKWQSLFLLACSIVFVALFSLVSVVYFILNIVFVYTVGILINKTDKNRKLLLQLALIWLIGNLCFFKYTNTFLKIGPSPWFSSKILMPLGFSYIIFRLVHYVVEVYRKNITENSFLSFSLFVLFFPTFLAGPVERFQRFYPQAMEKKTLEVFNINYGLLRIISGIIKKFIIADNLARLITPIFYSPDAYPRIIIIFYVYGLAVQLYMDFSGYTDMAVGIARLFGYKIMENFNKPYFQKNIALFWRSWHISVYSWIRDYFFFPVFGCGISQVKIYLGIIVTMVVFHLWHAATLSFLFVGIYHGIGLIVWKAFQELKNRHSLLKRLTSLKWMDLFSTGLTFSFVSFGCVFFNTDINSALYFLKHVFY